VDDDLNIKISDFGLSNIMEPGKRFDTFCGSLHYACPEILRGEKYLGPGVDIWSMGIILYCLVVGRQPWDGANAEDLIHAILEEGLEVPQGISDECVNLILSMLRVAEEDRIPISKMRYHSWILEGYNEPPESYLPPQSEITQIDNEIIYQMEQLGLIENENDAREEILLNEKTQLRVTYHLLLQQKQEKLKKKEERNRHRDRNDNEQEDEGNDTEKDDAQQYEPEENETEKYEFEKIESEKCESERFEMEINGEEKIEIGNDENQEKNFVDKNETEPEYQPDPEPEKYEPEPERYEPEKPQPEPET